MANVLPLSSLYVTVIWGHIEQIKVCVLFAPGFLYLGCYSVLREL